MEKHVLNEAAAPAQGQQVECRECERLRMQLTACGVVAMSNTPESAAKARDMRPDYMSASCQDVMRAVDSEMALRAELSALKAQQAGQEPVAFYWQDIGYPEPRKHGPYFGWPSESALRNVDGGAIPVPLYTLPAAPEGGEV